MKDKKLSRREREKRRHLFDILKAAEDLFSERGYNNVSVQEIADRAEFAVGTIYSYFKNKEDLYNTMLRESGNAYFSRILPLLDQKGDPCEIIRKYVAISLDILHEHRKVLKIFIAEMKGVKFAIKSRPDEEFRDKDLQLERKIAAQIKRGVKKGLFRELNPNQAALALMGIMDSMVIKWVNHPEFFPEGLKPEFITNIFFHGCLKKEKS